MSLIGTWWCDIHDHRYEELADGCECSRLTCEHGVTTRFGCNDCSVRDGFTSNAGRPPHIGSYEVQE